MPPALGWLTTQAITLALKYVEATLAFIVQHMLRMRV